VTKSIGSFCPALRTLGGPIVAAPAALGSGHGDDGAEGQDGEEAVRAWSGA
jgi:hypothetical protein